MPPERPRFTAAETGPAVSQADGLAPLERLGESTLDPRRAATSADKSPNVIAAGARWKGSLTVPDSVRIEGQFNGDIDAKGTVHIAEGASVEAKVKATFVVIGGSFRGEIRCTERTELLAKAKVQGDVITKLFTIHEGAIIDGSIHMSGDKLGENEKPSGSSSSRSAETPNGARSARAEPSPLSSD